uniref:Uncharacterized protein n=1 Tax=Arundo donax TaxID=35708 RepID=A0A0A8YNI8_ARUDO
MRLWRSSWKIAGIYGVETGNRLQPGEDKGHHEYGSAENDERYPALLRTLDSNQSVHSKIGEKRPSILPSPSRPKHLSVDRRAAKRF